MIPALIRGERRIENSRPIRAKLVKSYLKKEN
jgi:hypothetical protein